MKATFVPESEQWEKGGSLDVACGLRVDVDRGHASGSTSASAFAFPGDTVTVNRLVKNEAKVVLEMTAEEAGLLERMFGRSAGCGKYREMFDRLGKALQLAGFVGSSFPSTSDAPYTDLTPRAYGDRSGLASA